MNATYIWQMILVVSGEVKCQVFKQLGLVWCGLPSISLRPRTRSEC